jgi:hypothetical protein
LHTLLNDSQFILVCEFSKSRENSEFSPSAVPHAVTQALEHVGEGAEPSSQGKIRPYYLKSEIYYIMPWRVEILNETVAEEIAALPADMQARFVRLGERIEQSKWAWRAWANRT